MDKYNIFLYRMKLKYILACIQNMVFSSEKNIKEKMLYYYKNSFIKHLEIIESFSKFVTKNKEISFNSKYEKKIGIILLPSEYGSWYFFSILLGLLINYNHMASVEFIVDDLFSCEELMYYRGVTKISNQLAKHVLKKVKKYSPSIEIKYLSKVSVKEELDEIEIKEIRKIYKYSMRWLRGNNFNNNLEYYKILVHNAKYIKNFLKNSYYDSLNIYTALHLEKGVYHLFAKKNGVRLSSYDSAGKKNGPIFWNSNGPVGHLEDIPYVISDFLTLVEKQKIVDIQKKIFEDNILSRFKNDKCYQNFDVVIPLNIDWDAAALGRDRLFESIEDWLMKTLEVLLEKTNARIIVREHPARKQLLSANYMDTYSVIRKVKGYDENRVYYAAYDSPIDTYACVYGSKLVVPYTSTVGIEATIMGKKVLLATETYYGKCGIGKEAATREEYYELLVKYTNNEQKVLDEEKEQAYMALYFHSKYGMETRYNEFNYSWMHQNIKYISKKSEIVKMLNVIVLGKPIIYK